MALLDSLKAGADFSGLAKRYSEDAGTAVNGGDLGMVRRGEFIKEFAEAAFALQEGQTSKPVETTFGYHIIQLLERRGEAIHVRHILIKVGKTQSDDDSTVVFLKQLRGQALAESTVSSEAVSMKFAELAKKYSEDEESKAMGGDLGTIDVSSLTPDFLGTVKGLESGQISQPVKVTTGSTYAYQIVYLRKRIPSHKISLERDWKRVEQYASLFKRNKEYAKWISEIKKNVNWEIRL
jgi:peptidyl-prolyl cis-trans isomerase SurA